MRKALFGIAVLMCGCTGAPETGDVRDQQLEITASTDVLMSGTFAHAGSLIRFESRLLEPKRAAVRIEVNGVTITTELDAVAGELIRDAQLDALYREDIAALTALNAALFTTFPDGYKNGLHRALLFVYVGHLAEMPIGHTIDSRVVSFQKPVIDRNNTTWDDFDACSPCSGTGMECHDAGPGRHNFICTAGRSAGWSAPECEGFCGPTCINTHNARFDCFDHDWCLDFHGGSAFATESGNPDCGDEAEEAADDMATIASFVAFFPPGIFGFCWCG